jgi:hypothetical protein
MDRYKEYVLPSKAVPRNQDGLDRPWKPAYDMYLKDLHKDFAVTTADKLSNNYVIVCKKHYVSVMQDDLQKPVESRGFYQRVPLSFNIGDHLKSQVNHLAPEAYDKAKDSELKVLKKKPYASALVKLHKDPVTFRFLACSKGTGLQALGYKPLQSG